MKVCAVPADYLSLSEALTDLKAYDAFHLRIAADYDEPAESGSNCVQLNVIGPTKIEGDGDSRAILNKGLELERFEEPAVEVRLCKLTFPFLTVAGFLTVYIDDCEVDGTFHRVSCVRASIDVREYAEVRMTQCNVRHCQVGLRVHFPAKATIEAAFEHNRIGMALVNNPQVSALESTFVDNQWANATVQCRWTDGPILVQPELPVMDKVDVAIDGPWGSLAYKAWPLPTEQLIVTRRKRKPVVVDVSPRMVHCDHEKIATSYHPPVANTSSWAREVLGLRGDLNGQTLGHAYRKRARQVHPDKTHEGSVAFLRLKAAYDVLQQEIKKSRIK